MTKGGPNGNYGVLKEKADENGNLVMVISQGSTESEETEDAGLLGTVEEKLSSVFGSSSSAPAVDGSFSGWVTIISSGLIISRWLHIR